jgi:hypothetical protein
MTLRKEKMLEIGQERTRFTLEGVSKRLRDDDDDDDDDLDCNPGQPGS